MVKQFFVLPKHTRYLWFTLIVISGLFLFSDVIFNNNALDFLKQSYKHFLCNASVFLFEYFGFQVKAYCVHNYFYLEDLQIFLINDTFLLLRYHILSVIILLFLKAKVVKRLALILGVTSVMILLNILRIFFIQYFVLKYASEFNHHLLYHLLWLMVIVGISILVLKSHIKTINSYDEIKQRLSTKDWYLIRAGLVFALYFILTIIFRLYESLYYSLYDIASYVILYASSLFLNMFNYSANVAGRSLLNSNAWIYLGDACVGMQTMGVFIAFIIVFKGKTLNKIIYSTIGVLVILLLNVFRISALFIYLAENENTYKLNIDLHDSFNYVIYAAVLLMWWIYLKRIAENT